MLYFRRLLERIKVLPYVVIILLCSVALRPTRESGGLRSFLRRRSLFLLSSHHEVFSVSVFSDSSLTITTTE